MYFIVIIISAFEIMFQEEGLLLSNIHGKCFMLLTLKNAGDPFPPVKVKYLKYHHMTKNRRYLLRISIISESVK